MPSSDSPLKNNRPRSRSRRQKGRAINGILLLDKPLHLSSNKALQAAKHLFQARKAGHTGSLDPLATGMLPLCFGKATKVAQYLLSADKRYVVTAKLGETTATGDAEGEVLETKPVPPLTKEGVEAILAKFKGEIQQVPPMYSAVKIDGKPLYELARQGITVERSARPITIYSLKLLALTDNTLTLEVHCSKGTYIRTLLEDIGKVVGCGAYVTALRRTIVSHFPEDKMLTLDQLRELHEAGGLPLLDKQLLSIEALSTAWPKIILSAANLMDLRHGKAVETGLANGLLVRLYSSHDQFLGVGEQTETGLKSKYLL